MSTCISVPGGNFLSDEEGAGLSSAEPGSIPEAEAQPSSVYDLSAPLSGLIELTRRLVGTGLTSEQSVLVDSLRQTAEQIAISASSGPCNVPQPIMATPVHPTKHGTPFSIVDATETVIDWVRPLATARELAISHDASLDIPSLVGGDPFAVRTTLLTFLDAVISEPAVESVHISVAQRASSLKPTSTYLDVTIEPAWPGRGSTAQSKYLEERSIPPWLHNAGSATKAAIDRMGGRITYDTSGSGPAATLTFPVTLLDSKPRFSPTGLARTVLILDNNAARIRGLRRQLAAWGSHTVIPSSLEGAIAALAGRCCQLALICGELIPDRRLTEALELLEAHGEKPTTVLVTDRPTCAVSSADQVLTLPLRLENLHRVLKSDEAKPLEEQLELLPFATAEQ